MSSPSQPESLPITRSWLQRHFRLVTALAAAAVILLLLIVPPFISISRYKSRITELVSESLGRPARLSSVELRLLPRPGFVLTDLTVDEAPAFGAEPVLHAETVVAYIHFWSLWRGRVMLDTISVDNASLNLVRRAGGRWNVDSVLRPAPVSTGGGGAQASMVALPYMEATNSRINIKDGAEKLPWSLTAADVSLWQESGAWHVRLRGQPARTDVSLDLPDTGVVRMEATLKPGGRLREMPLHVDLDWRAAQLGQLSRLVLGSDEGWRGDLTGELHLDGTAEAAHVTTRLRATGVHRAEFEPASALDFDANCSFVYRYSVRGAENIACSSPIGNGRLQLTGNLPADRDKTELALEMNRVPAQAFLDLLRTVRSSLDDSLAAEGTLSGKITYAPVAEAAPEHKPGKRRGAKDVAQTAQALTGELTAESLKISGGGLSKPIEIAKLVLEPALPLPNQPAALAANVAIPAGGAAPLAVTARLGLAGFSIGVHGPAALGQLREFAHAAGVDEAAALEQISAEPAAVDLRAEGPWLAQGLAVDSVSGTVALHDATWKPEFLAAPVELASATLHLADGTLRWDPVEFSYGPVADAVKGTATVEQPRNCIEPEACVPKFTVRFDALDAAALQAALLGARERGTGLISLLARLRTTPQPGWPLLEGRVQAANLTAGPFSFSGVDAAVKIQADGVKISSFDARFLGGKAHGSGSMDAPVGQDGKPAYLVNASFEGVRAKDAGQLAGEKWSGGEIGGSMTLALDGFTAAELVPSAKGTLSFDWRNGAVEQATAAPVLERFSRWHGEAAIEKSALSLEANQVQAGARTAAVTGALSFGAEPHVSFETTQR